MAASGPTTGGRALRSLPRRHVLRGLLAAAGASAAPALLASPAAATPATAPTTLATTGPTTLRLHVRGLHSTAARADRAAGQQVSLAGEVARSPDGPVTGSLLSVRFDQSTGRVG